MSNQPELENTSETGKVPEQAEQVTVKVQRSVQINRLLIVGAVLGAAIAAGLTALFPVIPEGHYTLGQIVGFMALLGAAAGLLAAAILALLLNKFAKKSVGTAKAYKLRVE